MKYTEDKPYSAKFKVDYKIFAILYICYRYKFPISDFLTFYEMYGEMSLFIFKALTCNKSLTLTDNNFTKIIEQSKLLYRQIHKGITENIKIKKMETYVKHGYKLKGPIPEKPTIRLGEFVPEYREFISNYLQKNIVDLFDEELELMFDTEELYDKLK